MVTSIIIIVVSLIFSAFFSGMEIAFVSANRLRIELEKQKGAFSAPHIAFLEAHPREYIATMLVGNNIALVVYGLFMGEIFKPFLERFMDSEIGITLIQTLFSTIVILFTAEYLPKSLFRNNPNQALRFFALPVRFFYVVLYPITLFTVFISDNLLRGILKVKINEAQEQRVFGKVELDELISTSQSESDDSEELEPEIKLFQNALEFSDISVKECMVPRNEIEAIEVNSSVVALEKLFAASGFSRIPVYEESIDNIIGYAHHQQMFTRPRNIRSVVTTIPIVPASMSAQKLLSKLLTQQKSISIVVDEFGGTAGIVTIEDVLEEIFGEIEDEHDQSEFREEQISENEFIFAGRLEIDYINEKYGLELPETEDYETLAGFIFYNHESVPQEGDVIVVNNFNAIILEVDNPRIELVKLIVQKKT